VILPLVIVGVVILGLRRHGAALVLLWVVPVYFFTVQSAVHTEYRYVIAVTYFLFAFAGVAIACGVNFVLKKLTDRMESSAKRSASTAVSEPRAVASGSSDPSDN
jgi:hypothetical protein